MKKWLAASLGYLGNMMQGFVLNAFPALSLILTEPSKFGLSLGQYGDLFLPLSICAIIGCFINPLFISRSTILVVWITGLCCNLIGLFIVIWTSFHLENQIPVFMLLRVALSFIGLGFGFFVPSAVLYVMRLFPLHTDGMVLAMNGVSGLGTALSPLLLSFFYNYFSWEYYLLFLFCMMTLVFVLSFTLLFMTPQPVGEQQIPLLTFHFPKLWWLFAFFTLFYGALETIVGNWSPLFMQHKLGFSLDQANQGLSLFWISIMGGRFFFTYLSTKMALKSIYRILPLLLVFSFSCFAFFENITPQGMYLLLIVSGIGCSALLPLTISMGGECIVSMRTSLPGLILGIYFLGYASGSYGMGFIINIFSGTFHFVFLIGIVLACLLVFLGNQILKAHRYVELK